MWDGGLLLFPTDTGKLVWWSTSGEKVSEVKVLEQDYYVRLAWDEPQRTLFVCGFTTLNHVTLQRESSSGTLGHMQIHPHTCTRTHAHAHLHAHTRAHIHHHHIIWVNAGGSGMYVRAYVCMYQVVPLAQVRWKEHTLQCSLMMVGGWRAWCGGSRLPAADWSSHQLQSTLPWETLQEPSGCVQ